MPPVATKSKQDKDELDPELKKAMGKYKRGPSVEYRKVNDRRLQSNLRKNEQRIRDSMLKAAQSELLLTEEVGFVEAEGMEKTYKFTQRDIVKHVDLNAATKSFSLSLDQFGPYYIDYTRNGRFLLIGGRKGHLASFDWKAGKLQCEVNVNETVRNVKWLHNNSMFAVAQKKYVYIYDQTGMEVHCLRDHLETNKLEFLPYHYLLVSGGNPGILRYQDTSTGQNIAEHRTRLGPIHVMAQNPYNAVINVGHTHGIVTMWTPNQGVPQVKMLCHRGPVQAMAIDQSGIYMATAGLDGRLKVWDLRTYQALHEYYTPKPATSLSISQRGLLSVVSGPRVTVWKDALRLKQEKPYMTHMEAGSVISDASFCPFDDVLGFGSSNGIGSLLIPGAGEPNFDALELNPFETKKQRQEREVKSLLEKIQPQMIQMNPNNVGKLANNHAEVVKEQRQLEMEASNSKQVRERNKTRGRNSAKSRYLAKNQNIIDEKRMKLREQIEKEREKRQQENDGLVEEQEDSGPANALSRFEKKK